MTTKKQINQQEAMDLLGYKSLSDIQQKIYNGYRHIINANDVVAVVQFLTREGFTIAKSDTLSFKDF